MPLMTHDVNDGLGGILDGINMGGMHMGGGMGGAMGGGMGGDMGFGMGGGFGGSYQGAGEDQFKEQNIRPGGIVHVHASDKQGPSNPVSLADASKPAIKAQDKARLEHQQKLKKLKGRLAALKQKLVELQEEQSKKSQNADSPKAKRKEAIKKLLIKNLKLAAVIASKEIQLEEAKESGK